MSAVFREIRKTAVGMGNSLRITRLEDETMIAPQSGPSVEFEFTGKRYRRPPEATLFFDLTLRNENTDSRWFLLPAALHVLAEQAGVGVSGLEVFDLPGRGRVVMGRFYGTAGFQTVYLAAGATVKIRQFSISVAGETPDKVTLDVVMAKGLMIGDESAESWFGMEVASHGDADVSRDSAAMLSSRHTPDLHEEPVTTVGEERVKVQVDLSRSRKMN